MAPAVASCTHFRRNCGQSFELLFVNFCGCHENSQETQIYVVTYGAMFLIFGFTNRVMHDMDSLCL